MTLPNHIFREYDIRGLVANELTPEVALAVGRAYAARCARAIDPQADQVGGILVA